MLKASGDAEMKINYAGRVELSTIDWIGKAAYVVFLNGCPIRCPHCHNSQIRTRENWVPFDEITKGILGALPFVNHLVISGGEPAAQPDACRRLIAFGHAHGMMVAIETSGCLPLVGLFDRVFLSCPCSLQKGLYDSYVGLDGAFEAFMSTLVQLDPRRSEIRLILFKNSEYELATLMVLKGFPIRVMAGVGVGISTDVSDLVGFAKSLADVLGYKIKDQSRGWVLLAD